MAANSQDEPSPELIPLDALEKTEGPISPPQDRSRLRPLSKPKKTPQETTKIKQLKEIARGAQLENDHLQADLDEKRDRLRRSEVDHTFYWKFRFRLGIAGLVIVVSWQIAILVLVWQIGLGQINLPSAMALALITTTTVNVFGFLMIVMKFVFATPPAETKKPAHRIESSGGRGRR